MYVRCGVFDGHTVINPEETGMDRIDAQFATDPHGRVYLLDDDDRIVCGPVDPADMDAWSQLTDFVRGYLLDSR